LLLFVGSYVCRLSQRRSKRQPSSPTLPLWSACSSNVGLFSLSRYSYHWVRVTT
jgi:hypothetical protein